MKFIAKTQNAFLFLLSACLLIFQASVSLSEDTGDKNKIIEIDCSAENLVIPKVDPKKPFLINSTDIKKLIGDRESVNIMLDDTDELIRIEYLTNHIFVLSYWRLSEKAPDWRSSAFGIGLPVNSEENKEPLFRRLYDKHTVRNADDTYRFTVEAAYRIEACLSRLIEKETLL